MASGAEKPSRLQAWKLATRLPTLTAAVAPVAVGTGAAIADDSFDLLRDIYRVGEQPYRETLEELVALLALGPLLDMPVRQLSLGQRMRCDLAAALIHCPSILFLDEPTIGLDVTMQKRIREFVGEYRRRHGATVMLTSH